jgi:inner membrane protein involved in colicin E2 resistance
VTARILLVEDQPAITEVILEDHALLAGALSLFAALAVVMVLTRKVDWYRLTGSGFAPTAATAS